jgi:hypothetical protein
MDYVTAQDYESYTHEELAREALRIAARTGDQRVAEMARAIQAAVDAEEPSKPLVDELTAYLDERIDAARAED